MKITYPPDRDVWESSLKERPAFLARWPHHVTLGHYYPDMDEIHRWLWITFGPQHGECFDHNSEFPACPLVLAKSRFVMPDDPEDEPAYERTFAVEKHCHAGTWSTLWLGKTGYDYGNEVYAFEQERHLSLFLQYLDLYGPGYGDVK